MNLLRTQPNDIPRKVTALIGGQSTFLIVRITQRAIEIVTVVSKTAIVRVLSSTQDDLKVRKLVVVSTPLRKGGKIVAVIEGGAITEHSDPLW